MAYVYVDMDALAAYQQRIVQTLSMLETQVHCKEDLIRDTKVKLQAAVSRAEDAERAAQASLRGAEAMLREAEQRTSSYNANRADDQEPIMTSSYYYENVSNCAQAYAGAQADREYAENTLSDFEAYVRDYARRQQEGIEHFKKLLEISGKFFESYIQRLIEAKKCTAVLGDSCPGGKGRSGAAPGGNSGGPSTAADAIIAAGEHWSSSLARGQREAINAYTGSAYVNINATLRGIDPSFKEGNRERAVLIHQALSASSLPQACTVYRGASEAALGALQNMPDSQLVGGFFGDKGFMSTSLNYDDSFHGAVKLVIRVPAGAKGAYVGYLSKLGHEESEVLFDAGSVMQITKVERDQNGRRVIYAKMM